MAYELPAGTVVTHHRVLAPLGAGGMGVVYLAEDLHLNRKVALKFVGAGRDDAHGRARLLREARTASVLDHPNIATVYEVGEWNGEPFIAMAFCEGETLRDRLRTPMPLTDVARIVLQVAEGLATAHDAGIVHRDLKPGNVIVTNSGQVKILDFGLARSAAGAGETVTALTRAGAVVGTLGYMSPEQAHGREPDARADVWALGVVLYELLTGQLPFAAPTAAAFLLALTSREPAPVRTLRPDTPPEFESLVHDALQKDPARRTITAHAIGGRLRAWLERQSGDAGVAIAARRRRMSIGVALLSLLCVVLSAAWMAMRWQQRASAAEAIPEIQRLADRDQFVEAFELVQHAREYLPGDPRLARLLQEIAHTAVIETTPAGATVSYAAYGDPRWHVVGTTPLHEVAVPNGLLQWRVEKAGFTPFEDALQVERIVAGNVQDLTITMVRADSAPPGMVLARAPRRSPGETTAAPTDPDEVSTDFWMDRLEVSNRQYLDFMEAGGYRRPEFWRQPFLKGATTVPWNQAVSEFRDRTGRPGPSTWELGRYKPGEDDLPVTGVSWYEAAAYARFAGKQLPTLRHWTYVAAPFMLADATIPVANLAHDRLLPVGASGAVQRFGVRDLAGNAKEWILNESTPGTRYILGGAWDEPAYLFPLPDARDPWQRSANFGFRCVRYSPDDASIEAASRPVLPSRRDYSRERPVSDQLFRAYARAYSYDRAPIEARTEAVDRAPADWTRETVSFPAAYSGQRVLVHVFLPKHARPPYQAVVFVPGSSALDLKDSHSEADSPFAGFVVQSGRALIVPVLQGTYERSSAELKSVTPRSSSLFRDTAIAWHKDLARTLDYLETRDDISPDKLAYVAISRGACLGPIFLALDPRFKVAALYTAGFYADQLAPEVDVLNFAPRVTIPVLMLSGRYDYFFPEKTHQEPFFAALGTPPGQKRRLVYPTGHNLPRVEMMKETLDWLDRYLGEVR